jgi:small subunit ribosomal protein S17
MPKKEKIGKVVSNKMEKTIVVAVEEKHSHSKYGKIQNKTVKFKAHDESNECREGDIVRIIECRPYSKDKTWRLGEVLERVQEVS